MTASASPYAVRRGTPASRIAVVVGFVLLIAMATLPWWSSSPDLMQVVVEFVCILTIAQMWNLLAGYGGLISIGQQAFIGIGGYALVVLVNNAGVNPFLAVPLAGVVAAAMSVPTAFVVFRLRGAYFAVGTWVVAEVYRLLVANVAVLGGGSGQSLVGLAAIPPDVRQIATYEVAVALGTLAVLGVFLLLRSSLGFALTAIRDNDVAAESQGIDVRRTKLVIYVVAGGVTGLAGALYFLNALRISPDAAFGITWIPLLFFTVVIGGIGTIEGPIVGTVLYFLLRQTFSGYGSWYLIGLGALSIIIMLTAPTGLWGLVLRATNLRVFPIQSVLHLSADAMRPRTENHDVQYDP